MKLESAKIENQFEQFRNLRPKGHPHKFLEVGPAEYAEGAKLCVCKTPDSCSTRLCPGQLIPGTLPSSSHRRPLCRAGLVLRGRVVLYARILFLIISCRRWQIFGRAWQI